MGLLDSIERLINEHGSATILQERIALANDKYSALEKENMDLKSKINILETENQSLKRDNEQLIIKLQNFDEQSSSGQYSLLDEIKVKILVLLSKHDRINAAQIAGSLGLNEQVAKFHLLELKKVKMITDLLTMGAPARYTLIQEGRRYLIENNLIS
jgi:predicted ArsR family transcriptional regulator